MLKKPKCPVIAIEEHYWDKELADYYQTVERNPEVVKRLHDLGELRLKEMD
jgi:2,3-dihydroxybenzoate decarboxylase